MREKDKSAGVVVVGPKKEKTRGTWRDASIFMSNRCGESGEVEKGSNINCKKLLLFTAMLKAVRLDVAAALVGVVGN